MRCSCPDDSERRGLFALLHERRPCAAMRASCNRARSNSRVGVRRGWSRLLCSQLRRHRQSGVLSRRCVPPMVPREARRVAICCAFAASAVGAKRLLDESERKRRHSSNEPRLQSHALPDRDAAASATARRRPTRGASLVNRWARVTSSTQVARYQVRLAACRAARAASHAKDCQALGAANAQVPVQNDARRLFLPTRGRV